MSNRFPRRTFFRACGAGLLTASCGRRGSFFVPPRETDTLVLYDVSDPPTLDPARSWGFLDGRLAGLIFSNLVRFGRQAEILPDLAWGWAISEDGLRYTFHLCPEARFTNGRPVTAGDVQYSFERVLDPDTRSPTTWVIEKIQAIEIHDDHALTLKLAEPFAPFLAMLAMPATAVVPHETVEQREREGVPFGEQPVGGGPWILREWKHDQHVEFIRNEEYWGTKPKLRLLRYRVIGNPFTAIAEFETGNISAIIPLPIEEIPRWTTHPQWKSFTRRQPLLNTDMILFNCAKSPLDQPDVRQALARAIDTPLVLKSVREGAGTFSTGPIPPGLPGSNEQLTPRTAPKEEIQAILEQSGLRQRGLDLIMPSRENFVRTTGEVIQALWKEIGIPVRLRRLEWVSYRQALQQGDFDAAFRGWFADYPDGDNFLYPLFHSSQIRAGNMSRFRDARIDDLIDQSQRELDPARREALLRQANQAVYDAAPALFLWHQANYYVTQPWLHGFSEPLVFNGTRYLDEFIAMPESPAEPVGA